MEPLQHTVSRFAIFAVAFLMVMGLTVSMFGQAAPML